jgi:hypothetical protein
MIGQHWRRRRRRTIFKGIDLLNSGEPEGIRSLDLRLRRAGESEQQQCPWLCWPNKPAN